MLHVRGTYTFCKLALVSDTPSFPRYFIAECVFSLNVLYTSLQVCSNDVSYHALCFVSLHLQESFSNF